MTESNRIEQLRAKLAASLATQEPDTKAALELAEAGCDDEIVTEGLCHALLDYFSVAEEDKRVWPAWERGPNWDRVNSWVLEDSPRARLAARTYYMHCDRHSADPLFLLTILPLLLDGDQRMLIDVHLRNYAQSGQLPAEAFGPLIARVRSPDRDEASTALWKFGPDLPAGVIPILAGLVTDTDDLVKLDALDLLKQIGPKSQDAVPALRGALRGDIWIADEVLKVLPGALGAAAVPLLVEVLTDPFFRRPGYEGVRAGAARACYALESVPAARSVLRLALDDPDEPVRAAATAVLAEFDCPNGTQPPGASV